MYRRLAVINVDLEELGLTHRKNQAMLLRRLANNQDIAPLQTLVSIIEPVKQYQRYQVRPQNMLSPLTGLIDAAQADAPNARIFNNAVDEMLLNNDTAKVRGMLTEWRDAQTALSPMLNNAAALAEAKPLVENWQNLNAIGLEAISYLEKNQTPSKDWLDAKMKMLDELGKQKAGLQFAVLPGIKMLVAAANEMPNLKNVSPTDRGERIKEMAFPKKTN